MNYYNEFDSYCLEWLGNLTEAGHLPAGKIDSRNITEVTEGSLLNQYDQCHFFAGIGGWPLALRMAGWPEDVPVWTGSCPCQPFSCAGKQKGIKDERHLWPEFRRLIDECRPPVIFGEQVASKAGREWLSGVRSDLEKMGYVVGASDLCAASTGTPHIRQRLWWVAYSGKSIQRRRLESKPRDNQEKNGTRSIDRFIRSGCLLASGLGDSSSQRRQQKRESSPGNEKTNGREPNSDNLTTGSGKSCSGLADTDNCKQPLREKQSTRKELQTFTGSCSDFWNDFELVPCADEKSRRIEPGTFPLAHGVSARVGKLRAYGNAIVPQVAAEFIRAFKEAVGI